MKHLFLLVLRVLRIGVRRLEYVFIYEVKSLVELILSVPGGGIYVEDVLLESGTRWLLGLEVLGVIHSLQVGLEYSLVGFRVGEVPSLRGEEKPPEQ